jgi:hypothetical protein
MFQRDRDPASISRGYPTGISALQMQTKLTISPQMKG